MDKETAKKIKKEGVSWEDAVKLAMDTQVQTTKEYWEEQLKKREEGWGSTPGVAGKGGVVTKRRKPADPNYVHNIPQGDSYFMGNPNAKVTITEFYDFQ